MRTGLLLCLLAAAQIQVTLIEQPAWMLWGNPQFIHYDAEHQEYINENPALELWRLGNPELTKPEHVPSRQKVKVELRKSLAYTKPELCWAGLAGLSSNKRRVVLINVEETINAARASENDRQYRCWPHLGLLYVGTVADQEGWEVVLWDELVQGYAPLDRLIESGNVVGLSLVVTGVDRGVSLARRSKELGARYVIAGNDAAIFRASHFLQLPGKPIDAVFTGNALPPIREFFRTVNEVDPEKMSIPGMQSHPGEPERTNERSFLLREFEGRRQLDPDPNEVFVVPDFNLFPQSYWEEVWSNYRACFGHKHRDSAGVKNAMSLLAQGCTRAAANEVCSYCTIADVANIRIPTRDLLRQTIEAYHAFGLNTIFNVTDSILEMRSVAKMITDIGQPFDAMVIYGRAQGLARNPELIEAWMGAARERLLINVGMDSGDDRMLSQGVVKSSSISGSRLDENFRAVENIRSHGAHLHYSLIFGSPGETVETCERSIEFLEWSIQTLGVQLDLVETDIYWLNYGSPASRVFHDYGYAQYLASLAGRTITQEQWAEDFARNADELIVPWRVEEAWYRHFTGITVDDAQTYNERAATIMARHTGSIRGRAFKPSTHNAT